MSKPLILSGNEEMLKLQLIMLKALEPYIEDIGGGGGTGEVTYTAKVSDKIKVRSTFVGYSATHKRCAHEASFRLVNSNWKTITSEQVFQLAEKAHSLMHGFGWQVGKEQLVYWDTHQGVQLKILCHTIAEGIPLVERICELASVPMDVKLLRHSGAVNVQETYPDNPGTVEVGGHAIPATHKRIATHVNWIKTELKFPPIDKYYLLADLQGIQMKNLDFLAHVGR